MTRPSAREVNEQVDWLRNDLQAEKIMRERTQGFHDLWGMHLIEDLPEHMSRGRTRDMPSPWLQDLSTSVMADFHAYLTSVTLTVIDGKTSQGEADRIERALAIEASRIWTAMLKGGTIWHLLTSYGGWLMSQYGDPAAMDPLTWSTPNPLTCYAPLDTAPARPRYFGRHYVTLMRDIAGTYGAKRGMQDGGTPYMKRNGSWDRYAVGAELPANEGWLTQSGKKGWLETCEIKTLCDGEWHSHVAVGKQGKDKDGFLLWQDKCHAGPDEDGRPASCAVLISGQITGMTEARDRFLPWFMPGIQYTHVFNYINQVRATRSENNKGDVIEEPPSKEQQEAMAVLGLRRNTKAQIEQGGPNIIPVNGPATIWQHMPDEELNAIEAMMLADRNSWAAKLSEPSSPEVLAQINTSVALHHAEVKQRHFAPLLNDLSSGIAMGLRIKLSGLAMTPGKSIPMHAMGQERYGKQREMERGDSYELTAADYKDFDKRFAMSVALTSVSEEQKMLQLRNSKEREAMGIATPAETLAIYYPDSETQRLKLVAHEAYLEMAASLPGAINLTNERIRLAGGFELGVIAPEVQEPAPGGGGGTGTIQYAAPVVPGSNGASAPAGMA